MAKQPMTPEEKKAFAEKMKAARAAAAAKKAATATEPQVQPAQEAPVEEKSTEESPLPATEPAVESPKDPNLVDIISADGRELEFSINNENWKGKVISVPKHLEGEARRILEEGGFFIKN